MSITLVRSPLIRVDARGRIARSILLDGGRVVAVDPDVVPPGVRSIEFDSPVIPGLVDTHPHLLHFALAGAACVALFDAVDHADIVRRLGERAGSTPSGQWVVGSPVGEPHYFVRRSWRSLAEGELPSCLVLDRASVRHPIMIQAWSPTCPNVCAFNSVALAALGITSETPDVIEGVTVEKHEDGSPTGRLWGSVNTNYNPDPFFQSLLSAIGPPTITDPAGALRRAIDAHHRLGVTAIYEPHAMELRHVEAYRRLREQRLLTMRVAAVPELQRITRSSDPRKSPDELLATLAEALAAVDVTDDWVRVFGICASAHGGTPHTGAMPHTQPYRRHDGTPTSGTWALDEAAITSTIVFCHQHGLRFNACTIGPAEHELLLDVIERTGVDARGWIIQHGVIMHQDQIERFAALGMMITSCAGFTPGMRPLLTERFDDDPASDLNRMREWLDAGITVAASTDWGPTNPWEQMALAETDHGLTPVETFRTWTEGGSMVLGWPEIGSLAEGCYADFAVLSADVLQREEEISVLATYVAGDDTAT